jgi:hypothetical protein
MIRIPRKASVGAALIGTMLGAGAFGFAMYSPATGSAQTTSTGGATTTPVVGASGTFHGNEDPAHEKGESAQREADENSGKAFAGRGPGGRFHPNEDLAHEKAEGAQREAEESSGKAPTAP